MDKEVTRLFPPPGARATLHGLYLAHELHKRATDTRPFVYSNFVSSLDGRIGIAGNKRSTHSVPPAIANPRDWRLYQELAAQADLLITSGRFFRQSAIGEAQDRLPVDVQGEFGDILQWRLDQGLQAQPDIAIMSASLDFPPESLVPYQSRRIFVITGNESDSSRAAALQERGIQILSAGSGGRADGDSMISQLAGHGYRSIYSVAGPAVLHTLLEAGRLDRLYLTFACTLLGGDNYDTLTHGRQLEPAANMPLAGLYHDPWAPEGCGQILAYFDAGH